MPPDQQREITAKEVELTGAKSQLGMFLYCAFSFPLFLFALFGIRDITAILVFGLFAAFGVAGIVQMNVLAASQKKFGDLRLRLGDPLPSVGGRLSATLRLPASATAAPVTLHANLICNAVTYGEHRSRTAAPVRGVRIELPVPQSDSGTTVTIACDIPGDLPRSDDPGEAAAVEGTKYTAWELKLRADFEGVDLERSYAIEVGPMLPGTVLPKAALQAAAPAAALPAVPIPEIAMPAAAVPAAKALVARQPATAAPQDEPTSLWVLVATNLVPLAGVVFGGWRVHEIVFLYWIENLVIGAANLLRIRVAVPDAMPDLAKRGIDTSPWELGMAKAMLAAFFLAHYGAFCFGHGELLASMFPYAAGGGATNSLGSVFGRMLLDPHALVAIIAIVASHAYSYLHNYIGRGEYRHANMGDLMTRPYKRIGVTHIFVIVGGFALAMLDSPVAAMLVFVALKIGFDAGAHRRERARHAVSD